MVDGCFDLLSSHDKTASILARTLSVGIIVCAEIVKDYLKGEGHGKAIGGIGRAYRSFLADNHLCLCHVRSTEQGGPHNDEQSQMVQYETIARSPLYSVLYSYRQR